MRNLVILAVASALVACASTQKPRTPEEKEAAAARAAALQATPVKEPVISKGDCTDPLE